MGKITGSLEDREEIRELYAQYAQALDNGRYEQWVDCFTEDGAFESPRFGRHGGHEELRRFTAKYRESLGGAKPFHQITNVIFVIDGDRASGSCYLTYYQCKNGNTNLSAAGHYTDQLRKAGGEWKFQSRVVTVDGAHPQWGRA